MRQAHQTSLSVLDRLLERLDAVRAGFATLPVDDTLAEAPPAPLDLGLQAP